MNIIQNVFQSENLPKYVVLKCSKAKSMLIVFFDANGEVQHKYVPERPLCVLSTCHCRKDLREGSIEWGLAQSLIGSCISKSTTTWHRKDFLPSYSPDLTSADFPSFHRVDKVLKRHRYKVIEEVNIVPTHWLKNVPIKHVPIKDSQNSFQAWTIHGRNCVDDQGCSYEEF